MRVIMNLKENDQLFFYLSIVGAIGSPVAIGIFIYSFLYNNPNNSPIWKLFAVSIFFVIGFYFCISHIRSYLNQKNN